MAGHISTPQTGHLHMQIRRARARALPIPLGRPIHRPPHAALQPSNNLPQSAMLTCQRTHARRSTPNHNTTRAATKTSARAIARAYTITCYRKAPDMDWYAWLCKAGLDPDLAYEYALLFERNELGAADVRHLDHDFLASMGVAVAKHRLEILKFARKESSRAAAITVLPWRATRLLAAAVHRSAQSLAGYIRSVARRDRAAVAVAPRPPRRHRGAAQWKRSASSVARRSRKLGFLKHESRPMLTDRGAKRNGATTDKAAAASATAGCFAGPETCSTYNDADEDDEEEMDGSEEMPWESMFQDLKPT